MKTRLLFFFLLAFSFGQAQVSFNAPYASSVAATTANLNVYMNLNNTYQVSYQIATSSAGVASAANQGSQNTFAGSYNLVKNLTGLLPNTTYYFRFRALAFGVYTNSAISSFTTAALVPIISGVTSSAITTNGATINYTLNAQGFNTTSVVKYGLSVATMTSQVVGNSATGTSNTAGSTLLTGLTPNRQYYYQVEAVNANGTTTSESIGTFTTTTVFPIISAVSASVTQTTATINYTLNANGSNATSTVYTLDGGIIQTEITGVSSTGTTNTTGSVTFTGLMANTQYIYRLEATNSNGTENTNLFTFITAAPPQLIAEYTFNNTPNNVNGNSPFSHLFGLSYTADRHGNANAALSLSDNGAVATITGLPYGSNGRTVSFWVKTTTMNTFFNYAFHYGDAANGNGFLFKPAQSIFFAGSGGNNSIATSHTNNAWYHYVCTYDGTISKIYKDGVLISSAATTWNTVNNLDKFRLGLTENGSTGYFSGAIDDLKIYNYALTQADVNSLFTNNTLSSQDFSQNNLKVLLYPNPVKDVLNIETKTELKSVEIYNIQGQKVKTSTQKQTNVSDLASGIYMVRIQDENNGIATEKIVKQ
ncbi:LamG-like jellyroll fold domain-containing protein [Flavobacterium limnophilum]|uniref:LamG-like jellyroll fold domain-containing protein n=1 Tax=Flavobacterium limnophilum TaxID=3003262 RepID=UPI002482C8E8|nr:LamG-like jellyroll fold domain-containing protein [Flavobacterium limnophilum]